MEVIYKEAVGEHALDGACLLHSNGRKIAAHILAGAASEVLKKVSERETGFSVVQAYFDAAEHLGDDCVKLLNRSYNFFKHADRDIGKELHFDDSLTGHLMFLATIDLMRIQRRSPSKDGYEIAVSDAVKHWFECYTLSNIHDERSLCKLRVMVDNDEADAYASCVEHIKQWLIHKTDILKSRAAQL